MVLTRFAYLPEGVIGRLETPGNRVLYTIERPWLMNKPFVSCIPEQEYELEWDTTGRIRNVPRLRATGPRSQINIHAANFAHELHGCIAPGLNWSVDDQVPKVMHSRDAMDLLLEELSPVSDEDGADMVFLDGRQAMLNITGVRT